MDAFDVVVVGGGGVVVVVVVGGGGGVAHCLVGVVLARLQEARSLLLLATTATRMVGPSHCRESAQVSKTCVSRWVVTYLWKHIKKGDDKIRTQYPDWNFFESAFC